MLFEKQDYQHACVENILSILSQVNVRKGDYSYLADAVKEHYKTQEYTQFETRHKAQLDVLMETGTGKTYTYLKTIFELYKTYGMSKFVIVLPRVAIKLGVIQNICLTDEHFYDEYKHHLKYIDYPQAGIDEILHSFVHSNDLCILCLTSAAFNKQNQNKPNKTQNKLHERRENLFGHHSTWHAIAKQKPIVFIDEPHLLIGEQTTEALKTLNQSLFIRFGATYPKEKEHAIANVAYVLDSISSFQKYLVKQIRVNTVFAESEQECLHILEIKGTGKNAKVHVIYDKNTVSFRKWLSIGDDVGAETGLEKYKGLSITKITAKEVFLSDKTTLSLRSGNCDLSDDEIMHMVRKTIVKHFEKEEALFSQHIKALSLFFIPNIADFRAKDGNENPRVKTIFEREYSEIRKEFYQKSNNKAYKAYLDRDYVDGTLRVHEGYFSGDKGSKDDKEKQGIDIILKDKEKLLSFDTPLRFVFSVWALQEGWDNPNVVNVCKLAATESTISRRQQVGRGLRLSVNQKGKRQTFRTCRENEGDFYAINTLDVVVSAQEKEFIYAIQQEIQDASYSISEGAEITVELLKQHVHDDGVVSTVYLALMNAGYINKDNKLVKPIKDFLHRENKDLTFLSDEHLQCLQKVFATHVRPVLDGNTQTKHVEIKKDNWNAFKELWEIINKKAHIVYKDIEEDDIIRQVAENFERECENIEAVQVRSETRKYNAQLNKIEYEEQNTLDTVDFFKRGSFTEFLDVLVKNDKLPLQFVLKLCKAFSAKVLETIHKNPRKSKDVLRHLLKECIHASIISKVEYRFLETSIYPNTLQKENEEAKNTIESGMLGRYIYDYERGISPNHLLYNTVCYDSEIEKDVQRNDPQCINEDTITVFAKLPKISIPTPYKTYSPDFAYVIERQGNKKLFLVVETKGHAFEDTLRNEEKYKIRYAERFFESLQAHVGDDVCIKYKTRMNNQKLSDIMC